LADAAELWVGLEEFLELPFVLQEGGKILLRAHFPVHITRGPKVAVAID
jgi:hypothetical protein